MTTLGGQLRLRETSIGTSEYLYFVAPEGEPFGSYNEASSVIAYWTTLANDPSAKHIVVSYGFTVKAYPTITVASKDEVSPASLHIPSQQSLPAIAVVTSTTTPTITTSIDQGTLTGTTSVLTTFNSASGHPTQSAEQGTSGDQTASKVGISSFTAPVVDGTYPVGTFACKPTGSGSSAPICSSTSPSNVSFQVGLGVFAALFILALGGFLFLLFRRRRRDGLDSHSAPFIVPPSDPSHAIGSEKARITALEQQLQAAQTSLLATAVSKPAPIDDRTIASRFDGLAQEIKDWSLTHLRRNPGPHEFSPELREVLRARVPDYERLLTVPKTRGLVVRAAVSALLVDAFEDGYLFPGGSEVRAVEKGMRKNMSDSDFNSWRCSTYASIAASFGSERDLLPALEPLARRIDALVAPFADAPESRGRLKYLHRILYTFVTLSLTLLSQPAHFHILDPKPTPIFDCRTMDDVLQEHETKYSSTGRPENPLQGRQCSAVVFPGVEKWGNGQLGAEAEWESLIVVVKARVLV